MPSTSDLIGSNTVLGGGLDITYDTSMKAWDGSDPSGAYFNDSIPATAFTNGEQLTYGTLQSYWMQAIPDFSPTDIKTIVVIYKEQLDPKGTNYEGVANPNITSFGHLVEGEIVIDTDLNTSTIGNTIEFYSTLSHEFGHLLGLDHPGHGDGFNSSYDERMTIMSYNPYVEHVGITDIVHKAITPMAYDYAALQEMYGTRTDTVDSTYAYGGRFTGNLLMQTVWDSGGHDTFDLSAVGSGHDLRIDLRPALDNSGNFHDDHVSIIDQEWVYVARGANIEDAIGGAGNDTIIGNDSVGAFTSGSASYAAFDGVNHLYGGDGNDQLFGLGGNDYLYGGNDNDALHGGIGTNVLDGGAGDDTYFISDVSNNTIVTMEAGDQLSFNGHLLTGAAFTGDGTSWEVDYDGSQLTIIKSTSLDIIQDTITAGTLTGDTGNDYLLGNIGNDTLLGHAGYDTLDGGSGSNSLVGGDDYDSYQLHTDVTGSTTIDDDGGNLLLDGHVIYGSITLGEGAGDAWYGEMVGDDLQLQVGDNASDVVVLKNFTDGDYGIHVDTVGGSGPQPAIFGTGDADVLIGTSGDDAIYGDDGLHFVEDSLTGGDNLLYGGAGDDVLRGEFYQSFFAESHTHNTLYGGSGNDSLLGQSSDDHMYGGDGDDLFTSYNSNTLMYGGDGNDTMQSGLFGAFVMDGGDGDDTFRFSGGGSFLPLPSTVEIHGGAGTDAVYAAQGSSDWYANAMIDGCESLYINGTQLTGAASATGVDTYALSGYTLTVTGSGLSIAPSSSTSTILLADWTTTNDYGITLVS